MKSLWEDSFEASKFMLIQKVFSLFPDLHREKLKQLTAFNETFQASRFKTLTFIRWTHIFKSVFKIYERKMHQKLTLVDHIQWNVHVNADLCEFQVVSLRQTQLFRSVFRIYTQNLNQLITSIEKSK